MKALLPAALYESPDRSFVWGFPYGDAHLSSRTISVYFENGAALIRHATELPPWAAARLCAWLASSDALEILTPIAEWPGFLVLERDFDGIPEVWSRRKGGWRELRAVLSVDGAFEPNEWAPQNYHPPSALARFLEACRR